MVPAQSVGVKRLMEWKICVDSSIRRIACLWGMLFLVAWASVRAGVEWPCVGTATATLNVRSGPGTNYARVGQLARGERVKVLGSVDAHWVLVEYRSQKRYASSDYLRLSPMPEEGARKSGGSSSLWWDILEIGLACFTIYIGLVILYMVFNLLMRVYVVVARCLTIVYNIVSFLFFILNALQRYLAKPWFVFFKKNRFDDQANETLRQVFEVLKVPFYVLLAPLRLANAVFFNILVHCTFEMFNYLMEVLFPTSSDEGEGSWWRWTLLLPWRLIKYFLWHGTLTLVESVTWTLVDLVLPAQTLFHGTAYDAADSIVASPGRGLDRYGDIGVWMVGGGNYAGNGIYFAPARSTAVHYSAGSMIVCRVTLGRTLDLGLAPRFVYEACGHPDALAATDWGLKNGFVTGEWWRSDAGWWEYCMYDWQNRYNFSWRIRPLYVLSLETGNIQRIPGGMCHWLFRRMVVGDIWVSLKGWMERMKDN